MTFCMTLTRGHRLNPTAHLNSPYMTSYMLAIHVNALPPTIREILANVYKFDLLISCMTLTTSQRLNPTTHICF